MHCKSYFLRCLFCSLDSEILLDRTNIYKSLSWTEPTRIVPDPHFHTIYQPRDVPRTSQQHGDTAEILKSHWQGRTVWWFTFSGGKALCVGHNYTTHDTRQKTEVRSGKDYAWYSSNCSGFQYASEMGKCQWATKIVDRRGGLENKSLKYVLISRLCGEHVTGSSFNKDMHQGGWRDREELSAPFYGVLTSNAEIWKVSTSHTSWFILSIFEHEIPWRCCNKLPYTWQPKTIAIHSFRVLEARSSRSAPLSWNPTRGSRGESMPCLFQLSGAAGIS